MGGGRGARAGRLDGGRDGEPGARGPAGAGGGDGDAGRARRARAARGGGDGRRPGPRRKDRRRLALAGVASLLVATWIALATADVHAPEAYTLPFTAVALVVGWRRRRQDPATSPWLAYGGGLVATAGPSLDAALATGGVRSVLLGAAALAVTLVGARARLQAPLAVGAATLAALVLREVGPALLGLLDRLPAWTLPAAAGALLLAAGSTYERRLRELRRARDAFARLA